jgi:hypothetical protein
MLSTLLIALSLCHQSVIFTVSSPMGQLTIATGMWNATEFVSFAIFNGHLILCNGSDKPLDIDDDFTVEYCRMLLLVAT